MSNLKLIANAVGLIAFAIFFLFCGTLATAQVVHAFIFCKTGDTEIGESCDVNFDKASRFCNDIADALNRTCVEHKLRCYNLSYNKADSTMRFWNFIDFQLNVSTFIYIK